MTIRLFTHNKPMLFSQQAGLGKLLATTACQNASFHWLIEALG
ncbi:hypothetical protein [Neptunicella sp. SCSIO 80796]